MNGANIMVKNVADFVISTPMYLLFGYALSFGDAEAPSFVGSLTRGSVDPFEDPAFAFFQLSFAATAATIDSGALAERCDIWAYLVISGLMTAVLYPIVAHWAWS